MDSLDNLDRLINVDVGGSLDGWVLFNFFGLNFLHNALHKQDASDSLIASTRITMTQRTKQLVMIQELSSNVVVRTEFLYVIINETKTNKMKLNKQYMQQP